MVERSPVIDRTRPAGWLPWAVAGVVTVLTVLGAAFSSTSIGYLVPAVLVAAGTAAVPLTRAVPMLVQTAVIVAAVIVICTDNSGNPGWFTVCFVVGGCVVRGQPRVGILAAVAGGAVFVVEWSAFNPDPGWGNWIAGTAFALLVTLMFDRQRTLMERLHEAQAGLADRARIEERSRISRELHDVIAHSLTVSLLHVSSARLAVEHDPGEAAAALAEAERLGRQSLTEVRQAVGLLREGADRAPLPGTDQLAALVEGFRRAGADVSYEVAGDASRIGAAAGLGVYRIMQEALTNAARHAPGTPVTVRLCADTTQTELIVDSAGPPVAARGDGVGLLSMGERAAALGGRTTCGPSGTGWRVHAVLPHEAG